MKASISQYSKTLLELTDGKSEQEVLGVVKKFAEVLKKEGQLKNAPKIMEKFSDLYNKAHGIVVAEVVSCGKLENATAEKISGFIKEKYAAKEVVIKNTVDEKIKGGIVIKIEDEVIDGSVSNQLNKLKRILYS